MYKLPYFFCKFKFSIFAWNISNNSYKICRFEAIIKENDCFIRSEIAALHLYEVLVHFFFLCTFLVVWERLYFTLALSLFNHIFFCSIQMRETYNRDRKRIYSNRQRRNLLYMDRSFISNWFETSNVRLVSRKKLNGIFSML